MSRSARHPLRARSEIPPISSRKWLSTARSALRDARPGITLCRVDHPEIFIPWLGHGYRPTVGQVIRAPFRSSPMGSGAHAGGQLSPMQLAAVARQRIWLLPKPHNPERWCQFRSSLFTDLDSRARSPPPKDHGILLALADFAPVFPRSPIAVISVYVINRPLFPSINHDPKRAIVRAVTPLARHASGTVVVR